MRLRSLATTTLMSLMLGSAVLVGCAKHEDTSGRENAAATRAEDAARRAESAASRCEAAAQRAEAASERAERSFHHGIRK